VVPAGAALVATLLLALWATGAAAAADPPGAKGGEPPDSARHLPSPFSVMLRSAAVPGWGQITNHKLIKAVVVVGGEGLLIYKALGEYHKEQDASDMGDDLSKERHYNLKVNYIWWAIAVHLLQMADAYVDAHLASFDADFGPEESSLHPNVGPSLDRKGEPRLAVAVHVRF
jgi:hypothetical protein